MRTKPAISVCLLLMLATSAIAQSVQMFEDDNFRGDTWYVGIGKYSNKGRGGHRKLTVPNDEVRSMIIPPGIGVYVTDDDTFKKGKHGVARKENPGNAALRWNIKATNKKLPGKVSSIYVYTVSTVTGRNLGAATVLLNGNKTGTYRWLKDKTWEFHGVTGAVLEFSEVARNQESVTVKRENLWHRLNTKTSVAESSFDNFQTTSQPLGLKDLRARVLRGFTTASQTHEDANVALNIPMGRWKDAIPQTPKNAGFDLTDSSLRVDGKEVQSIDQGGNHWQGIARCNGRNSNYLVVTRSNESFREADFSVVDRQSARTVYHQIKDSTNHNGFTLTNYKHAGGIQMIGKYGVYAIENPKNRRRPGCVVYDFGNPSSPVFKYVIDPPGLSSGNLGTVGMIKLRGGQYFMCVGNDAASKVLHFYVSEKESLASNPNFRHVGTVRKNNAPAKQWGNYQTLNLVTDNAGELWLVGMFNTGLGVGLTQGGADYLDVHKLSARYNGSTGALDLDLQFEFRKHMKIKQSPSKRFGHFQAGAGAFMNSDGKMFLYAVEFFNTFAGGNGVGYSEFAY